MRRVVISKPGSYNRLEVREEPDPTPEPGQVLVRSRAAGVNYADCIIRMGLYSSAKHYVGYPITPGFEFAGEVAAVGAGVTAFRPGDAVFGVARFGGYSSHVVVPPHQLFALPEGFDFARAAAFPTVHLTAWYALCELSRSRPGQRVLVHSAAGGVGTAALRIARHLGLEATAVVGGAHKVEAARAAGAAFVIDYKSQDLWREAERLAPGGFDLVMESNGGHTLRKSYEHVSPAGRLLVYGFASMMKRGGGVSFFKLAWSYLRMPRFNPLKMVDKNISVSCFNLSYLFELETLLGDAVAELLAWEREGALPAPPITEYPLDAVADAHRSLESGETVGKLVLTF
jgi:NADPH:quinone reductase-like Zn-dependent oxidoreductase